MDTRETFRAAVYEHYPEGIEPVTDAVCAIFAEEREVIRARGMKWMDKCVAAENERDELKAREAKLRAVLVKAAIQLEVLAAQIANWPYGELSEDLQKLITATVVDIRAALAAAPVSREGKL